MPSYHQLRPKLTRSSKTTFTVLDGEHILKEGQETARHLWNFTRWCVVVFNYKLSRQREGFIYEYDKKTKTWLKQRPSMKGKYPKYPGKFALEKEIKDYWAAKNLSDRCFSSTIKEFDIAMRSWFSNLKSNPKAKPPKYATDPRQLTFEVGRNAKPLGDWTYRLTILGGHIKERYAIVKIHIQPGLKMRDIKLIRIQPDLSGTVVHYQEQAQVAGDGFAGIVLGIINIATVAFQDGTSLLCSGKGILESDQYYQKRAAKCKPTNWEKGKEQEGQSKRLKAYRRKAGNKRRLATHNLTRHIVNECIKHDVNTIVIGDLKGIRNEADHGKRGNLKLHAWPFAEILRQLEYKAEEVGISVKKVSERGTSKKCHYCGKVGTRNPRGLLKCKHCQIIINSDVNGAFNILNKVSPSSAFAGVGVGAKLPGPPSPGSSQRTGKVQFSQIPPTSVAKFDLRNWSIVQDQRNESKHNQC